MKSSILACAIIILLCNNVFAQNPYLEPEGRSDVPGQATTPTIGNGTFFPTKPITEWLGETFIFLPRNKDLQEFGYQLFHEGENANYSQPSLNYLKYVGRQCIVTKVNEKKIARSIIFQMKDDGTIVRAEAYSETIDDLALVTDIDSARGKWLGKVIWYKGTELVRVDTGLRNFVSTKIKKYSPVVVLNIVAGWYGNSPIRFIIGVDSTNRIDTLKGFVDIHVSNTNIPDILQDNDLFQDHFLESDPREDHKWSKKTWEAIENERVFVGMTSEQAIWSWGKPKDINSTRSGKGKSEQWVYSDRQYLYFEGGKLTTIQGSK